MSEMQDAISKILSNPEAMKQVKSLGEQLGLSNAAPPENKESTGLQAQAQSLAPLMSLAKPEGDVANLLHALEPFLSGEKRSRLAQAQRLIGIVKIIPLLKEIF